MRSFYLKIEFNDTREHKEIESMMETLEFESCTKITQQFQRAICFLLELNDVASSTEDKYIVIMMWIVNAIGKIFPKAFKESWENLIEQESLILSFSRLLKFVKDNPNFKQNFFFSALTHHFIIATRLSLSEERMTQISINTILRSFDNIHLQNYFEHMTGIFVSAFLKYKSNNMIANTFNDFISNFTKSKQFYNNFTNTQFIFWEDISNSILEVTKDILEIKCYLNETLQTKSMLILLADKIMNSDTEHLLLLNLKYFLEILHSTDTDEKNALNDPETRSEVLSKVMWVKDKIALKASSAQHDNDFINITDYNELLDCYADFISSIGIGDSISNESSVRINNVDDSDNDDSKSINLEEIWIDGLWVLDKDYIKLNRKDSVEFCINVYKRLKNLIVSIDRPPNNILFSIWQLEWLINNSASADKHGLTLQVNKNATKIMPKIISKFTTFEDSKMSFDEWKSTISFWSYLISWIDNNDFKQVFEALYPLVQTDDFVFIQQILPYFVYYAVRFNDDDSVVDTISKIICNFLKHGNYHQKLVVFSIVDFMNICLVQDKASVKQYSQIWQYEYKETIFQQKFIRGKEVFENQDTKELVEKLNNSAVIGCSRRVIIKTMSLLDKISLELLSKVALSIKEYKRAAIFFEEHVRKNANANSANGQITSFIEDNLKVDEVWSLVDTYSMVLPNDVNKKEFKHLIDVNTLGENFSNELVISKLRHIKPSVNQKDTSEANQKFLDLIDVYNNEFIWSLIQNSIEKYKDAIDENEDMWDIWCKLNEYFNKVDLDDINFADLDFNFESPNIFTLFENIWIFLIYNTAKWIYDPDIDKKSIEKWNVINSVIIK